MTRNLISLDLSKGVSRVMDNRPWTDSKADRLHEIEDNRVIAKRVCFAVLLTMIFIYLEM